MRDDPMAADVDPATPDPTEPALAPECDASALTDDAFLGGRLRLWQPKRGYRAATDPVLLAAATPARPGQTALDMGCGVGAAALCLAARVPSLTLYGLERQASYAALSERNATRSGAAWRVFVGDVAAPPADLRALSVDHVLTNPPFFEAKTACALPDPGRDVAHREAVDLDTWIDACLRRLRPRGSLTMIHRVERLPDILAALSGRAGAVSALPLLPRDGAAAKRVVVRAVKEAGGPFRLAAGLVLHQPGGNCFTSAADAVLREGAALDF